MSSLIPTGTHGSRTLALPRLLKTGTLHETAGFAPRQKSWMVRGNTARDLIFSPLRRSWSKWVTGDTSYTEYSFRAIWINAGLHRSGSVQRQASLRSCGRHAGAQQLATVNTSNFYQRVMGADATVLGSQPLPTTGSHRGLTNPIRSVGFPFTPVIVHSLI